jgi:hypothetical protein
MQLDELVSSSNVKGGAHQEPRPQQEDVDVASASGINDLIQHIFLLGMYQSFWSPQGALPAIGYQPWPSPCH